MRAWDLVCVDVVSLVYFVVWSVLVAVEVLNDLVIVNVMRARAWDLVFVDVFPLFCSALCFGCS